VKKALSSVSRSFSVDDENQNYILNSKHKFYSTALCKKDSGFRSLQHWQCSDPNRVSLWTST